MCMQHVGMKGAALSALKVAQNFPQNPRRCRPGYGISTPKVDRVWGIVYGDLIRIHPKPYSIYLRGKISTPYNKKDPSMGPLCLRLTQERSHCIAAAWLRRVRPHVGTLGDKDSPCTF